MQKFLAVVAFAIASALASSAAAGTLENAFSNTIITATPDGQETRWLFNADGSVEARSPTGETMRGRWERSGDQLCIAPDGGTQACVPYVDGKNVGDSWTSTATDGSPRTVRMVAGR